MSIHRAGTMKERYRPRVVSNFGDSSVIFGASPRGASPRGGTFSRVRVYFAGIAKVQKVGCGTYPLYFEPKQSLWPITTDANNTMNQSVSAEIVLRASGDWL